MTTPSEEARRRQAVAWAIAVTAGTHLEPKHYERQLLHRFRRGELTIDDVIALLDVSVYHVFYRSQATYFPTEAQLQDLLEWSRTYNAAHGITGLLLYSDGRFAQVIEGPEQEVKNLFDHIREDERHQHVIIISDGPGPQRWFADWQMAFGQIEPVKLHHMLRVVEEGAPPIFPLDDPHLQTLVEVFGLAQQAREGE